jgi:hypothetical protein
MALRAAEIGLRDPPENNLRLPGNFRVSIGIDFYAKIGYPFILKSG